MSIKSKLRQWAQMKMKSISSVLVSQIAYQAEHLNNCVLNSNELGVSSEKYCENEIIVSLTTYGSRLYDVYLAIESIMQQTVKPNKIVLWLQDDLKNIDFPVTLRKQQKRGLEIRYCKDIRSYKKLIPSLKSFPQDVIITVDDDYLYRFDLIENLINAYKKNPNYIYSARMHRIKLRNKTTFQKYKKWTWNYENFDASPLNFPTGAGGVLYPPHCLNEEVFNEKVFMDICKYADDIWFKAMALMNNTLSQKIFTHNKKGEDHISIANSQDTELAHINVGQSMNDVQLKAVFDKYNLYDRLSIVNNLERL